jgi:riboflavin kinase / FMN adenylyltransferase
MKIYTSLNSVPRMKKKSAVTIGVFDGVHVGHRRLMESVIKSASDINGQSVVITFKGHPSKHLDKNSDIKLIKSTKAKIKRIKNHGVDILLLLDFKKIQNKSAEQFVREILADRLNAGSVSEGSDFVFGKGGKGNIGLLKKMGAEYGFKTIVIPGVKLNGKRVSSTYIRECLKSGEIKKVEKMLGRQYSITGKVLRGQHIGFALPTANLALNQDEMPARGVWAVKVEYAGHSYTGAANIGFAPTLKKEKKQLLEVFIFDFNRNIYGKTIRVIFLERLRDEIKFPDKDILLKQVKADIAYIKKKYDTKTEGGKQ